MAELELTVDVDAAPADAFAYLADLTHLAEWDSSVRSAELASDTGPAIGRTFEVVPDKCSWETCSWPVRRPPGHSVRWPL